MKNGMIGVTLIIMFIMSLLVFFIVRDDKEMQNVSQTQPQTQVFPGWSGQSSYEKEKALQVTLHIKAAELGVVSPHLIICTFPDEDDRIVQYRCKEDTIYVNQSYMMDNGELIYEALMLNIKVLAIVNRVKNSGYMPTALHTGRNVW